MATRRRTTFRRRTRKRFFWTGINTANTAINIAEDPAKTIVQIIAPSQVATFADILIERVIIDLHMVQAAAEISPRAVGVYLATVASDVTETPVGEALWPPLSTDIDAMQKRPMWSRLFLVGGETNNDVRTWTSTTFREPWDITVKRKLNADRALVLVLSASDTTHIAFLQARVLCSVGRK